MLLGVVARFGIALPIPGAAQALCSWSRTGGLISLLVMGRGALEAELLPSALCWNSLCGVPTGEARAASQVPGSLAGGNAPWLQDITRIFSLPKTLGTISFQKLSRQELSPKPSLEPAHELLCRLSWLLAQHEAMGT